MRQQHVGAERFVVIEAQRQFQFGVHRGQVPGLHGHRHRRRPGNAFAQAWDAASGAYVAIFEGAILNPHTVSALFHQKSLSTALHDGTVSAVFNPLSETAVNATPLILAGLSVAVAFRAGLFNIGAQSQLIGGAILAIWLGFGVSLPPVIHVIVCVLGAFAGGAALGWIVGFLKARTGAHEVIVTLLLGAFAAAVFASAFGTLWLGLIAGSLAGGLVGLLLGIFAITYLVDQIILGVVLNVFVSGLTGYLYDKLLVPYANTLNSPSTYLPIKIPLLGDIPIIGPVFFDSTLFLYITYILIVAVQVGLFSTRWGLRVRAVGEHPAAADTVGISVRLTRYRNVILAGLVAGIGGAFLTIGSVGSFGKDMSSGKGYIALAAMIFGRWTPLGGVGAALLFGFTFELQSILSTINVPVPSDFLLMVPYVATIIAVAGLVGQVKAPAADGQPYITS